MNKLLNPIPVKLLFCPIPRCFTVFMIVLFFSSGIYGQTVPANNTFSYVVGNNAVASPQKMISVVPASTPAFTFSYISPAGTTGPVIYYGESQGLFQPSNSAFFFNYTTGAAIPGAQGGATGTGDYRMHFTAANPGDTGTNKLGNFGMGSMYLAIGTGNTATVTVQGFRAGRMVASAVISGLSTNDAGLNSSSLTDLSYSGSDDYSGLTISFGSNWEFLDGLRFLVSNRLVPLSVDNLVFNTPTSFAPATQASAVNFTNTTGITSTINWTKGTGDRSAVFMKAVNSGSATVTDGTSYTANAVFGSGSTTSDGWFCMYNAMDNPAAIAGATNSVNVTNVTPGTVYRVKVVSYHGSGSYVTYNTADNPGGTVNVANVTTVAIPSTQASSITVTPDYTDFRKASINWTRGNGAKSAVFVKNNTPGQTVSATVAPPHNDNNTTEHTYTAFTDSLSVTANARVGSTGWYCVYNDVGGGVGAASSVDMTRITIEPNQTLNVMVVEYNGGAGAETYNTSSGSSNVVTYAVPNRPLPVTAAATGITATTTTLNGTITPRNGNITSGSFTYSANISLSPALGTVSLIPTATTITGSALTTTVSGALTGLSPSTTYYYSLSAVSNANTNAAATDKGSIPSSVLNFTTGPVISNVTAGDANGSYKAGLFINILVSFTSAVTVTGTPQLALNSGGTANYLSGSGTTTLTFRYQVGATDNTNDLDYTGIAALTLSGGTIRDAATTDAALTLPALGAAGSLGANKNIIVDTQVPSLGTVTISSDNPNPVLAKTGNIITVSFTASETINTPTVTIAGIAASISNTGGNNWTAVHVMTGSESSGIVSFSIAFSDIANNSGVSVTTTTNSSSVDYDKTLPFLSAVSILSSNATTGRARTGDLITLNFTSSEPVTTPAVTIAGNTAAITNTGSNNWRATYTMGAGDAAGLVPFNISFSDMAGNTAVVTATTNNSAVVFDKTAPVVTPVSIVSNNPNTSLARVGDIITVSFTANEAIATPTVTIAGHTATVNNTAGNAWAATYTMIAGDTEGIIGFSIAFADISGNAGTPVNATTNSSAVVFDKVAPILSAVTIASNNANTTLAKAGDQITISFTASEAVFTPTVTIATRTAAVSRTSGNNWSAVYTMTSGEATGNIPFSISFTDITGNTGTTVTATTNSSVVNFDKTVPTITPVTIISNNTNPSLAKTGDQITISFTASEAVVTPTVTIATHAVSVTGTGGNNWSAVYTMASADAAGSVPFSIFFMDISGNTGTVTVTTTTNNSAVRFDKTAPVLAPVSIVSNNSNPGFAKVGDIVTVSFTANETVFTPTVSIAGSGATASNTSGNTWTAHSTLQTTHTAGTVPFSISVTDLAGNTALTVTSSTNSSRVIFDKTAPVINTVQIVSDNAVASRARTGNQVMVRFTSSEEIAIPSVTIAGHTAMVTTTGTNNWTANYTMADTDAEGAVAFAVTITDLAGNAGITVTTVTDNSAILFDRTRPSVTAHQRLSVSPTGTVTVQYAVVFSEKVTGVDKTDFGVTTSLNGVLVESVTGADSLYTVTINTGTGDGTIRLDLNGSGTGITDLSGNTISSGYTTGEVYTVSKIGAPVITIQPVNSTICAGNNTTFSITATSSVGITYQWQVNDGSGFVNLSNTATYNNVTTNTLSITNAGASLSGYQYRCIATNVSAAVSSNAVVLTVNPLPVVASISGTARTCQGNTVALTNATPGGSWTSTNTAIASVNATGVVTGVAAGSVTITYSVTNASGCTAAVSIALTVNALPTISIQPATGIVSRGNSILLTASATAGTTIVWTPAVSLDNPTSFTPLARPLDNTNYIATVSTAAGCMASSTVTILSAEDKVAVTVPEVFTPNGDGINDRFVIKNIDAYPENTLQIFNKAGKVIYEAKNYNNQFDGTYKSLPLPTDTYFYVLKAKGVVIKKGAINIVNSKR